MRDKNLLGRSRREMNRIRGKDISMIFQEPMTALNPVQRIYRQISEAILAHEKVSKTEAKARSIQLLKNGRRFRMRSVAPLPIRINCPEACVSA